MEAEQVKKLFEKLGYFYAPDGRLNLYGIRMHHEVTDHFDDCIGVVWDTPEGACNIEWKGTTDAGRVYVQNPMNAKGCAVMVPGQYSAWKFGLHNGHYDALIQIGGPIRVYRDANRDGVIDEDAGTIEEGYFGVNIHRGAEGAPMESVGPYSAGCQVFGWSHDFDTFMKMAHADAAKYGYSVFSYALFELEQFQLAVG